MGLVLSQVSLAWGFPSWSSDRMVMAQCPGLAGPVLGAAATSAWWSEQKGRDAGRHS